MIQRTTTTLLLTLTLVTQLLAEEAASPSSDTARRLPARASTPSAGAVPRSEWSTTPTSWTSGFYDYDGSGNIIQAGADVYRYDPYGRLAMATAGTVPPVPPATVPINRQDFTYDRYGNLKTVLTRTSEGTMLGAFAVNEATNQLDSDCPAEIDGVTVDLCHQGVYDAAGSGNQVGLTSPGRYHWDPTGTLSELDSLRRERYIYDANDERIVTIDYTGTTEGEHRYALRGADNKVARELTYVPSTSTWIFTKDYVYRGGTLIASFSGSTSDPDRHYHLDHLGSTRLVTNSQGHRMAAHTYWPFGREAAGSDTDTEKMKFTGHERDGSANSPGFELDYMHARYYDPNASRFLSIDPIIPTAAVRQQQRWNRYAYVANNPMMNTDPTGKLMEVRASTCDETTTTCYTALDAFQTLKEWVGEDAAKDLEMGPNGQVTLAEGVSFAEFARHSAAAAIVANLLRSVSNTAVLVLSANVRDDRGNVTSAYTRELKGEEKEGTITEINPAMFPSIEGGVIQTMDTALAHDLGGHGLQDMWGISTKDKRYGSMDQRVSFGVKYGEAFAVTFENQYRASQNLDIRSYYMNPYDYDPPPGAPKP